MHLTIESAGSQECGIQHIGPVSGGQHDDTGVALESIHLSQQLVDGLLTLVVTTTHAGATLPADCVNLIDEHDARRLGLSLYKQTHEC